MAESGTGIKELMAAETRASQIVAEARIGKNDTMRIPVCVLSGCFCLFLDQTSKHLFLQAAATA